MANPFLTRALLATALMGAPQAQARPATLVVDLHFLPSAAPGAAKAEGDMAWFATRFALTLVEPPPSQAPEVLGENREETVPVPIHAAGSLARFAFQACRTTLESWGAKGVEDGDLKLSMELVKAFVLETDTYLADVRIRWSLRNSAGTVLWQGLTLGSARQSGRSLKAANYNEVLSGGLLGAFANLVNDPKFREAVKGGPAAVTGPQVEPPPPMSAPQLLEKLQALVKEGFDEATLVAFVRQARIAPALTAEDLLAWKRAGLSPAVLQAALGAKGSAN